MIVYDSTYMRECEIGKFIKTDSRKDNQELGAGIMGNYYLMSAVSVLNDEQFWKWIAVMV